MSDSDTDIREEANELQSYLESFNKEIQIIEADDMDDENDNEEKEVVSEGEEEGTYFVDQAGNYYYQATKDSEPLPTTDLIEETEKITDEISDNPIEEFIEEDEVVVNKAKNKKKTAKETKKKMKTRSQKKKDEISFLLIMDDNLKQDDDKSKDWKPSNDELSEKDDNEEVEEENTKEVTRTNKKGSSKEGNLHVCGYCDYSSTKRYLLARHLKSHSDERPYKCSICERGFKTQASLQNHVNTHTGIKPHQCTYCSSAFTTSGELVRHIRYRHTHEKPHKCTECDYASVELSKLKRHIRCHTGERPYQCPHCTYASPDTFKLKRHLRIHTGEKPYECDICHARFTQSNSLKAHKLIHSVGDKPVFQCELCPTTCGRKTDLRIHVQKLHTSDQPLKCRRCNQLFPDRYSYKVHLKTHDGEKCFKCELCPYASISARHLESHMLIHTDQKPYECSFCDQSFRQKQLLKRHNNLYHNKDYIPPRPKPKTHLCPDCGRSFSHKGNLIRHMAVHDPESGAREEAFALKMGRQKKIQVLGNDEAEVEIEELITGDNDIGEKEEMDIIDSSSITIKDEQHDIVSLQTDENQQYVVLEVIQMENHPTADEQLNEIESTDENQIIEGDYIFTVPDGMRDSHGFKEEILEASDKSHQDEMEVCFGFDVN